MIEFVSNIIINTIDCNEEELIYMEKKFKHVYQFKIVLEESEPLIWRRIRVLGNYTFWDLHSYSRCHGLGELSYT